MSKVDSKERDFASKCYLSPTKDGAIAAKDNYSFVRSELADLVEELAKELRRDAQSDSE